MLTVARATDRFHGNGNAFDMSTQYVHITELSSIWVPIKCSQRIIIMKMWKMDLMLQPIRCHKVWSEFEVKWSASVCSRIKSKFELMLNRHIISIWTQWGNFDCHSFQHLSYVYSLRNVWITKFLRLYSTDSIAMELEPMQVYNGTFWVNMTAFNVLNTTHRTNNHNLTA